MSYLPEGRGYDFSEEGTYLQSKIIAVVTMGW